MPEGNRTGDAREAADWVSYANDPDHKERKRNGAAEPLNLKLWQLGNETSYGSELLHARQAIAPTIEFARAMSRARPLPQADRLGRPRRRADSGRPSC